jgi:hypothetical protein
MAPPESSDVERDVDDYSIPHHLLVALCVAIPLFVAIWVGLIALAASISHFGYEGPMAMGAGVGVLAGVFWAGWYAFVEYSQHEEVERREHPGQM